MSYSVGQLAQMARVTVRTLHHYDQTGLLRPSRRERSGYRSYSDADLERLQIILCYRRLGFALDDVKALLDDPAIAPLELLRHQHALLSERIAELRRMAATVEKLMEARTMGINLDPNDYLDIFGDSDHAKYHQEAEQRWGETDAWTESQRRVKSYTKDDWKRIQAEQATLEQELGAALTAGLAADSPRAMELAERHLAYLERWFYPCGYAMHRGLGDLYINDPRFEAHYAKVASGLAHYLHDAIYANASHHGA